MTTFEFTKGHAAGSDFILIADPEGTHELTPALARQLCDRRAGIGADGVIRAVRSAATSEGTAVLDEEPDAEWFMDLWDANGAPMSMHGNGIRVFADFLISEGWASPERRDTLPIGTREGVRDVLAGVSGFTVDLGRWRLDNEHLVGARGLDVPRPALGINLGTHHLVTVLAHEGELDSLDLSVPPQLDPPVNTGRSVEFVVPDEQLLQNGVAYIRMRAAASRGTGDSGLGQRLLHGTEAAAAALAFRHWGGEGLPHHWSVETPGGKVAVRMFPTEIGEHVSLSGPTDLVYRGQITLP